MDSRQNGENENGLTVRMLGGFSVSWKGKELALGRNTSARFIQLLQIVWFRGDRGITKEQLVEDLYDREEITNINSSFNTLVYRMRHQLQSLGLPEADYVVRRKGLYVPDEKIPIWVDVREFEKMILRAREEEDETAKARCYQEAFDLYKGELLPDLVSELWVFAGNVELKKMFSECVNWLGDYTRRGRDYQKMEMVYAKAARIYPLEEWEVGEIDALLCREEFKKARQLYNKTVRLYSDQLGVTPSDRMLECYDRMSKGLVNNQSSLSEIQAHLREHENNFGGVFFQGSISLERTIVPIPVLSMPIAC